jgi:hypothetical protein
MKAGRRPILDCVFVVVIAESFDWFVMGTLEG